jgi:hypothetical protein
MSTKKIFGVIGVAVAVICLSISSVVLAQDEGHVAAQANNPLANFKAFNIHNYYIGDITTSGDTANQFWLRYAQPVSLGDSAWLIRASLPVFSLPVKENGDWKTGVGDFNVFAAWLVPVKSPAISFGVGPLLNVPTAMEDELGSEKWSAGVANILFDARSALFQYGYLLTWQHSFAGGNNRDDVNVAAFQPFAMLQLGGGHYLRSTGIMTYNIENDNYSVPIGLGYGKVFKVDNVVYNAFIEPQVSVLDDGPGQPEWQVFIGFNMQFVN